MRRSILSPGRAIQRLSPARGYWRSALRSPNKRAVEPGRRNQILLRLLYFAGLRISETAKLKWRDLRPGIDPDQVTVFGKSSRPWSDVVGDLTRAAALP